jgi:hypothetical protein
MKRGIPAVMVLVLALTLVFGVGLYAQVTKDKATGLDRIEGKIQSINKDKSTMAVMQSGGGTSGGQAVWQVAYSAETKFSLRNKPAKMEDVKEGMRVIVLGKYDNIKMNAARIDIRDTK